MTAGAAVHRLRLAGALAAPLLACAPPAVAGAQGRPGSATARLVDRAGGAPRPAGGRRHAPFRLDSPARGVCIDGIAALAMAVERAMHKAARNRARWPAVTQEGGQALRTGRPAPWP
jgi:hypothetical protein